MIVIEEVIEEYRFEIGDRVLPKKRHTIGDQIANVLRFGTNVLIITNILSDIITDEPVAIYINNQEHYPAEWFEPYAA